MTDRKGKEAAEGTGKFRETGRITGRPMERSGIRIWRKAAESAIAGTRKIKARDREEEDSSEEETPEGYAAGRITEGTRYLAGESIGRFRRQRREVVQRKRKEEAFRERQKTAGFTPNPEEGGKTDEIPGGIPFGEEPPRVPPRDEAIFENLDIIRPRPDKGEVRTVFGETTVTGLPAEKREARTVMKGIKPSNDATKTAVKTRAGGNFREAGREATEIGLAGVQSERTAGSAAGGGRAAKKAAERIPATRIRRMIGNVAGRTQAAGAFRERVRTAAGKAAKRAVRREVRKAAGTMTAMAAGGTAVLLMLLLLLLFGGACFLTGDGGRGNSSPVPVSEEVEAYEPLIRMYAKEEGIFDYVELVKAVMMQESGGRTEDPMQASECGYNTLYPNTPGGITDPAYSIQVGVRNLATCLTAAEVQNPLDLARIRLALQGYNFGNGYISWAKTNYGGYSYANAVEFSAKQAKRYGWEKYGDTQYVSHVLRYYPYGSVLSGGGNPVLMEIALSQVGNEGGEPYWSWYGFGSRVEWCACFVSWCADQCGYLESGIVPKFSLCSDGVAWFRERGQWEEREYHPKAGDLIFFDWERDGRIDHVGIVERCKDGMVDTVEGNAGDACKRQSYPVGSGSIYGYGVIGI